MREMTETINLDEIASRLDRAGVAWVVFAGAAAGAYGAVRLLTDVDILVPATEGRRVAHLFPEARVHHFEDGTLGYLLPGFDILAGLSLMDLDDPMAARRTYHDIAGVTVPVIPPEDNILLKAVWGRSLEQGKYDWQDVEAMMAHQPQPDWEYLRWRARSLGSSAQVRMAIERLEKFRLRLEKSGAEAGLM